MRDDLKAARDAFGRGDYGGALDALDSVATAEDRAELLELRAQAAYGAGEFEASIEAWEELHTICLEREDPMGAASAAAMIAMYLMIDTGLMATVRGWLRTAERLLDSVDETPAHAMVAMTRTYERFMCGDMAEAGRQAAACPRS